jgi:hypothetical protein
MIAMDFANRGAAVINLLIIYLPPCGVYTISYHLRRGL